MQIERIEVTVSEVCNLGNYSSTKPSVTLSARLDSTDDAWSVLTALADEAKAKVRELIDTELVRADQSPKYDTRNLFNVSRVLTDKHQSLNYFLIHPVGHSVDALNPVSQSVTRMPFDYCLDWAMKYGGGGNTVQSVGDHIDMTLVEAEIADRREQRRQADEAKQRQRDAEAEQRRLEHAAMWKTSNDDEDDDESDDEDED